MLQSKVDGRSNLPGQRYSFSSITQDHLDKMGISACGLLELKPEAISRGVKKDVLGADSLWSSDMLCRHLQFLEGLVPRNNEAAARLWINAFFYRVAVMIPTGANVVLSVEQVVPFITVSDTCARTLSGDIDCTAMVMSPQNAQPLSMNPVLRHLRNDESALLVSEAKGPDQLLENHVQHTIGEILACARITGNTIIRGVLTNGREWIFIVLKLNDNGGGTYLQSDELTISSMVTSRISQEAVSLISAIISHWMEHSHEELDVEDDYFTVLDS
ncbi:hypothetical protein HGRIS_013944 [Hohenbuehelia grisea]|uniref:Uncharacterized protein n=1 Tax=Hohenbuehelia grisea TaxID=104357 RepID=A0ABR3JS23_9AGAR